MRLGHVVRWYATGTDIHERVKAEERIRNENQALQGPNLIETQCLRILWVPPKFFAKSSAK